MSEAHDSRVQFFNSQSSFGSASNISTSRLQFQYEEMLMDTDNFFQTLKATLRPDPDTNKQQVRMIINRAKIMSKETMPNYIDLINRKRRPTQHLHNIKENQERLLVLIEDYEKSQRSRSEFDYFYEKYSNAINKFSKKVGSRRVEQYNFPPQPDVVTIVQYSPFRIGGNSNYHVPKTPVSQSRARYGESKADQTDQVIIELKGKIKELKQNYNKFEKQLKQETNERIQAIINSYSNNDENERIKLLQKQLKLRIQQQKRQREENNQINLQLQQINKKFQLHQVENQRLRNINKSTEEKIRRQEQSRVSQDGNRSIHSEYNGSNDDLIRKLHKTIRNLQYENELLKNQLKKQRDIVYRQLQKQKLQQDKQKTHLKSLIDVKNKQLKQTKIELDLFKVEHIKLSDQVAKLTKKMELLKISGEIKQTSRYNPNEQNERKVKSNPYNQDMSMRPFIQEYIGDGNENLPYYEFMNKEYRIRYRRSCCKEKQLLHKSLGLEVGVISQFVDPNELKLCIYLANFDNRQKIQNLKLKLTNSKNNKAMLQNSEFGVLDIEQQQKAYLSVNINHYPIGCTVLICEYDYYEKHEQIRILLPVHVFKMLKIKAKSQNFIKPIHDKAFALQRKIGKDIETISSYFKGANVEKNIIKCLVIHEHSQTFFICDLLVQNGYMSITYEHKSGDERITEYIIKSIKFLFKKQEKE